MRSHDRVHDGPTGGTHDGVRRILVTGGCGFIGQHLVRRLLAEGRAVTVLDDLSTGSIANLPVHPALTVQAASVLDDEAVTRAASEVDAVYHLAGVVGVRLVTMQRELAYRVATEGTQNVLDATGETPVVLFSSSAVYGLEQARRASESVPLHDDDALAYDGGRPGYALGKLHMEHLGAEAARSGRPVLVVRPFNVVGPGQSSAYGMVLPTFVRRALAGQDLHVHDDGRQTRCFSDVDIFLEALDRLVQAPEAWHPGRHVYNLGAPIPTRILDLAHTVRRLAAEHTGTSVAVRFLPYAEAYPGRRDVRARIPDTGRFEAVAGPVHWPPVRDMVARVLEPLREGGARETDGPGAAGSGGAA